MTSSSPSGLSRASGVASRLSTGVFVFALGSDSGTGSLADTIVDFQRGADRLDLVGVDANTGVTGNQAFRFDTNGVLSAGEIRQAVVNGDLVLSLNTDSDWTMEMQIVLRGLTTPLTTADVLM